MFMLYFDFNRYNRAEVIQSLGWTIKCGLPEEIEEKLSNSEKEYFKNHSATLRSYMKELDIDLGVVRIIFTVHKSL